MIEIEFKSQNDLEAIAEQLYGFSIDLKNHCIAWVQTWDKQSFELTCNLTGIEAIDIITPKERRRREWEELCPALAANSEDVAIYVACLASYNAGELHGLWIDATQELDDIQADIATMLEYSPSFDAEEYAIHDYQGFGDIRIGEHESLEKVRDLAIAISEHEEAFSIWWNLFGQYDETANFEDEYLGKYDSKSDYVWERLESTISQLDEMKIAGIPISSYLDLEKIARDWECSGLHFEQRAGKVYVFS